jgi:hypothetical protein
MWLGIPRKGAFLVSCAIERRLTATLAACVLSMMFSFGGAVRADGIGPATPVIGTANIAIRNALRAHRGATHSQAAASTQPTGTTTVPATRNQGLPTGLAYTADLSMAVPFGEIGNKTSWLPGGGDAIVGYGFDPTLRASLSFYELQHYPVGFNSGTVPLYIQGFAPPVGSVDLSNAGLNVTTKDRFFFVTVSKLFHAGPIPVVVSPIYLSRWSTVGADHSDIVAFEYNGFPITDLHTRTAQYNAVAVTLPLLSSPRMFGTFTVAPAWLTHLNGVNETNHMQLYQILYVEYNIDKTTKIFFQPQSTRDYLPPDPYPEHTASYFLGIAQKITKESFVQLALNSGGPTNYSPYGVYGLTCQAVPCSQNPVVPSVGGLKATQLQIQIGFGTPSVLPF